MINEKYSYRDFTRTFKNRVMTLDGNTVTFWRIPLDGGENDYVDARIKFTSGVANDKIYRITANTNGSVAVPDWGGTIPKVTTFDPVTRTFDLGDTFEIYWDLTVLAASKFNNTDIIGSCFAKERGYQDVFPAGMTGARFIRCNVDNCNIPVGNTVMNDPTNSDIHSINREIDTKNDLEDWICTGDGSKTPVEPVSKKLFEKLGLSTDPNDIPIEEASESVTSVKLRELNEAVMEA
jgi:hypothetical protein